METAIGILLESLFTELQGQSIIVYLLLCFIIFLLVTAHCVINYLLRRISALQKEQEEYSKMSKVLLKQALYKQNGVLYLND